jgi:hypothetical protein
MLYRVRHGLKTWARQAPGLWATVLVVGLAASGWPALSQNSGPSRGVELSFSVVDTMVLPGPGSVTGMTWIGPDTLVVLTDIPDTLSESGDREVRMIFRDRMGEILRMEDFTGVLDRTLAWDGEFLWGCGDAQDGSSILYQIEPDTLRVEEAFNTPGHRPVGMCWDGRFLWITDRDGGRVDRFDPEVKEITRSVVTPGFTPFGLAWDGLYMWVTDSGTGRMYRLAGSRRNWSATVDTESFLFRGHDVHLLHDGQSFWYIPAGDTLAYQIRFD